MIQLKFGKISKRPNSTKQTLSDTKVVSATLKESVSIEAPIFKVSFDPSVYNYVTWATKFTRYYYIVRHTAITASTWEVECKLDIPATYRSLYLYGVSGHCVYSTDKYHWDEYFDDMRFAPSNLDQWTHSGTFFADLNYVKSVSNVFGHTSAGPKMWDITWSKNNKTNEYYASSYGDGCYVIQTICKASGSSGMYTYLMPKVGFKEFMNALSGISGYLIDYLKYIVHAIWMPVKHTEILKAVGSDNHTTASQIGIGPDVITMGETTIKVIPNKCVLSFGGSLSFPVDDVSHPLWMENNRWNTTQLATPGGITDINLDLCFPCSGRKLCFSTFFDVPSGTCDTKFTHDSKGTDFDNIAGTSVYESSINIGTDCMGLITKNGSPLDPLVHMGGSVAPAIGGVVGTAIAGPAGAMAGATMGGFVSKINPTLNTATKNFTMGSQVAQLFNNSQPGGITLRMKPWRCRELSEGDKPYDAYCKYCEIHGYPVNKYIDWHDTTANLNNFWVLDDVYIDPDGLTSGSIYTEGLTDEVIHRIVADFKSGIWLE